MLRVVHIITWLRMRSWNPKVDALGTDVNSLRSYSKECPKLGLGERQSSSSEASKEPGFGMDSETCMYSLGFCKTRLLETEFQFRSFVLPSPFVIFIKNDHLSASQCRRMMK